MQKALATIATTALLATGCGQQSGNFFHPSEYHYARAEGCDSGEAAAGNRSKSFRKSSDRYESEDAYREGWDDGYAYCRKEYDAVRGAFTR